MAFEDFVLPFSSMVLVFCMMGVGVMTWVYIKRKRKQANLGQPKKETGGV